MRYTPCFTAICGLPARGEGLLDWVKGDKNSFITLVQESVHESLHGVGSVDGIVVPMRVILAPPHLRRVGQIHADCVACFDATGGQR